MPIDDRNFIFTLQGRGLPTFIKNTYLQKEKFHQHFQEPIKMRFRRIIQIPIFSPKNVGLITFGGLGDQLNALLVVNSLEAELKASIRFHSQSNSATNFFNATLLFPDIQLCKRCLKRKTFHRFLLRTRLEFRETVIRHETSYLPSILPKQIITSDQAEITILNKTNLMYPVFGGLVSDLSISKGYSRLDLLARSLGVQTIVWPKIKSMNFDNYFGSEFEYITIHDGIDPSKESRGISTKQLDADTWNRIISEIKYHYPLIKIVQLGTDRSQRLTNVDLDLRGLTTLDDVSNILYNSKLHIDGDSGIARFARVLGVPLVTFFLSTSPDYYGLPGAEVVGPKFCGSCSWWSNETWNFDCLLGMSTPICRKTFPWEEIVRRADKYLSKI